MPGLVRGREHSAISRAMKPRSAIRFAGRNKLVHLIGLGEVVQRLGRGFAERLHRTIQIGQGITDRTQLAAFALHGFILPCASDKTGILICGLGLRPLRGKHSGLSVKQEIKRVNTALRTNDQTVLAAYGGFNAAMKKVTEGVSIDDYSTWRATCALRIGMRLAEREGKSGVFLVSQRTACFFAPRSEGGVGQPHISAHGGTKLHSAISLIPLCLAH